MTAAPFRKEGLDCQLLGLTLYGKCPYQAMALPITLWVTQALPCKDIPNILEF